MKKFNEFYISSARIFWAVNFAFSILIVLLLGFIFGYKAVEMFIELLIAIVMTIVLIWILGGFKRIKTNYLERKNNKESRDDIQFPG